MTLVLWFSSGDFGAENTGSLLKPLLLWLLPWLTPSQIGVTHSLIRKAAHVMEYAILALLWFRALVRGTTLGAFRSAWLALVICILVAIADESHQATLPERTASVADVVLDSVAATAALVPAWLGRGRAAATAASWLLGLAVIGGMSVLVFNLTAGTTGGWDVWFTAIIAGVVLLLYSRGSTSPG
jgi:VanZ family protein